MEFTVGRDTKIEIAPQEIRESWIGQYANMVHLYNSDERRFLELFGVVFSLFISRNRKEHWIPQAYSTSESED
ncbi:MAG: hypothetical protein LBH98_06460 [Chitinispirillales bacterium]|jgi:hypothetical protein|nr:hypothetical protein [Chitinispirillales bacterium]